MKTVAVGGGVTGMTAAGSGVRNFDMEGDECDVGGDLWARSQRRRRNEEQQG